MRPAYSTLGLFLVLTLFSLGACGPLFLIPACEYDPRFEFCQQSDGSGMGNEGDGGMAGLPDGAPPPPTGPHVVFKGVAQSLLNSMQSWVGIRSPDIILFTNQATPNSDVKIQAFNLRNSSQGWKLLNAQCLDCPASINGFDLAADHVLTSKSRFFLMKTDYAYSINTDSTIFAINSADEKLSVNFRPFVSPDKDILAYQKKVGASNSSEFNVFLNSNNKLTISLAARTNVPGTTYYIMGDLDGQGKNISDSEILIFEGNTLRGAYRVKGDYSATFDKNLTDELNGSIRDASSSMAGSDSYLIRTGFVADLNNDGYMELVYARANQIFVATYNPRESVGHRFINWPSSIVKIEADRAETLSAADLDGDGYLDLAVETRRLSDNQRAVNFYLSFSR